MSYLVFDNFCPDIDRVKDSVFAAGFDTWNPTKGEVGSSVYEGMGFWGNHALMIRSLTRALGGAVLPNTMYFRVTNVGMEKAYIHSDRETGNHTCVCYLTEHDKHYGTAFYRHRRTGLAEMPSFVQMQEMGILEELKADMVSRDPAKWTELDFVHGVKNRALVFPAPLFHCRVPFGGIGRTPKTGRLIWASHFYKLAPNGEMC